MLILSELPGNEKRTKPIIPTCRNCSLLHFLSFSSLSSPFSVLHVNARTSTAIVSTLPERITIAAFYPRRERGPRTFLKFWWPPPDGPRRVTIHTSYWFFFRRSFRSCRVRLSLTRLHTTDPSPLVLLSCLPVCAYLLKSFVYTTGVLTPDKSALRMRKTHTCACMRMSEGENEREEMRERWCVPTHHWPLPADEIGARSNRERRGSKAPKVPIPNGRRWNVGVVWISTSKAEINTRILYNRLSLQFLLIWRETWAKTTLAKGFRYYISFFTW